MRILVFAACLGGILGSPLLAQQCTYPGIVNIHCHIGTCDEYVGVGVCNGPYGNPNKCLSCANKVACCNQQLCNGGDGASCHSAASLTGKVAPCDSTVRTTAAKGLGEAKTPAKEQPKLVVEQEGSVERVTQTKTGS
jgi:hypothetical protein